MQKNRNDNLLNDYQQIIVPSLRKIIKEEERLSDLVWFTRHLCFRAETEEWNATATNIRTGAIKSAERLVKKYGTKSLLDYKNDFEWGMINGKLAMIRWIMSGEEDDLST